MVEVLQSNLQMNRSRGLLAIALLTSGIVGSSMAAAPVFAEAGPDRLVAQQIVDGLPPPPNVERRTPQNIPDPARSPSAGDRQYLVIIDGDSQRLLEEVQQVATSASIQNYQGDRVIVAAFDDSDRAEQQVERLASRGINAQIIPSDAALTSAMPAQQAALPTPPDLPPPNLLPTQVVPRQAASGTSSSGQATRETPSGSPREVEFGDQSPSLNQFPSPPPLPVPPNAAAVPTAPPPSLPDSSDSSDSFSERGYYVVIPGEESELEAITNQVIRLGDGFGIAQLVQQSDTRGAHVQIGPFNDRQAARRWKRYFRDFGMDARVYRSR